MIPVSVVIVTKNAGAALPRCLAALDGFAAVIVVDSHSSDDTAAVARTAGARVVSYEWDGRYPKKRQWCLENLDLPYDWVFFVDADEVVTPELRAEISQLMTAGPSCAGYFVRGRYVSSGQVLRFGMSNNKLALFDRRVFSFPVVDDLDLPMGEIEGHYQPVGAGKIGQLRAPLHHYADEDRAAWQQRHERYALWEAEMIRRGAYPRDPVRGREWLKRVFRRMPGREVLAFVHSYIVKGGIFDGPAGWRQARDRFLYYRLVARALRN